MVLDPVLFTPTSIEWVLPVCCEAWVRPISHIVPPIWNTDIFEWIVPNVWGSPHCHYPACSAIFYSHQYWMQTHLFVWAMCGNLDWFIPNISLQLCLYWLVSVNWLYYSPLSSVLILIQLMVVSFIPAFVILNFLVGFFVLDVHLEGNVDAHVWCYNLWIFLSWEFLSLSLHNVCQSAS